MQAWLAARQWELLFVVAMMSEWPSAWLWIVGVLLVVLVAAGLRSSAGSSGRTLAVLLMLVMLVAMLAILAAVLSAPDLVVIYLDGALQRAGLRIVSDLLLGAMAGLFLLALGTLLFGHGQA